MYGRMPTHVCIRNRRCCNLLRLTMTETCDASKVTGSYRSTTAMDTLTGAPGCGINIWCRCDDGDADLAGLAVRVDRCSCRAVNGGQAALAAVFRRACSVDSVPAVVC